MCFFGGGGADASRCVSVLLLFAYVCMIAGFRDTFLGVKNLANKESESESESRTASEADTVFAA